MTKKLTEKALMKRLDVMSQEELVKIIIELFKTNKTVEARLNMRFLGEEYGSTAFISDEYYSIPWIEED